MTQELCMSVGEATVLIGFAGLLCGVLVTYFWMNA